MRDMGSPHKRMQELCDCFAETDPLREMAALHADMDEEEAPLKWLALAVLHGVDRNAREISLERTEKGDIRTRAIYRDVELPPPGKRVGDRIVEAARRVTHIEEDEGEMPLAVGIRDSSIDIRVKIERDNGSEKVTLLFG
jgi:hypothetical protein